MESTISATLEYKASRNKYGYKLVHHMKRTPSTLSELRMARGRWFDHIGDHVTEVNAVEMWTLRPGEAFDARFVSVDKGYEFVTEHGRGLVMKFQGGYEVVAFIPRVRGRLPAALFTGAWKKKGARVGWGMDYVRSQGFKMESKKVDHTCIAAIYNAAAGIDPEGGRKALREARKAARVAQPEPTDMDAVGSSYRLFLDLATR